MRTPRIGLFPGTRATRLTWLTALVLPAFAAGGCGSAPTAHDEIAASEEMCPPDDPDCDRLDQPCASDDDELDATQTGPGSSPMGLAEEKNAAGKYRVWPKGRVPYKVDSSVGSTTKSRLLQAMSEWEKKSQGRVRFEQATSSDSTYLVVSSGNLPITSVVGFRAGTLSKVRLRNPEYLTVIRHELGHVLSLHHEQRRADRGSNIQVNGANIVNTALCKNQFSICTDCEPIGSYDVKSVMHYRTSDLSKCQTGPVLLNKDGSTISHPWLISDGDLAVIAELYGPPPGTGSGGSGGSSASDAGKTDGAIDAGSGDTTPSSGGSGGAAGSGAAGMAGSDSIDMPDEPGGASGAAGVPSTAGAAGAASAEPSSSADAVGGCSTHRPPHTTSAWLLLSLALASLGLTRHRRS